MEVPVEKVVERFVEVSFHACANTHRRTHTHTHDVSAQRAMMQSCVSRPASPRC